MAEITDFLELEPIIAARLKAQIPELRDVLKTADLAGVKEQSQITPAVHMLYGGYTVADDTADGLRVNLALKWNLVLVVKHAKDVRAAAGPLLMQIVKAMTGWKPTRDYRRFKLVSANFQPTYRVGFAYLPLAFETRIVVDGTG